MSWALRVRSASLAENPHLPVEVIAFAIAQIICDAAVMFTANELEVSDLDGIVIENAAKKQASVLLRRTLILESLSECFDEIQGQPDLERSHLPDVKRCFRHERIRAIQSPGKGKLAYHRCLRRDGTVRD